MPMKSRVIRLARIFCLTTPLLFIHAASGITPFQVGQASWYGERHHGLETASGEAYNMYEFTAAHPWLPFGSRVRVTNMSNGRSVIVRINDRGPFAKQRIVDVSFAAARRLGILGLGLASVRLELIRGAIP